MVQKMNPFNIHEPIQWFFSTPIQRGSFHLVSDMKRTSHGGQNFPFRGIERIGVNSIYPIQERLFYKQKSAMHCGKAILILKR